MKASTRVSTSKSSDDLPDTQRANRREQSAGFLMFPHGAASRTPVGFDDITNQIESLNLNQGAKASASSIDAIPVLSEEKHTRPIRPRPNRKEPLQPASPPPRPQQDTSETSPDPESFPELQDASARQIRASRLAREAAALLVADREYVRIGGVLRDPVTGKRDMARTQTIRQQIAEEAEQLRLKKEREEQEKQHREEIASYDTRWHSLMHPTHDDSTQLSFEDIPFPIFGPARSSSDGSLNLTRQRIADFLFSPLRGSGRSKRAKDTIRDGMLRWHPDKFQTRVLNRVREEDREAVREGSGIVMQFLGDMMELDLKE